MLGIGNTTLSLRCARSWPRGESGKKLQQHRQRILPRALLLPMVARTPPPRCLYRLGFLARYIQDEEKIPNVNESLRTGLAASIGSVPNSREPTFGTTCRAAIYVRHTSLRSTRDRNAFEPPAWHKVDLGILSPFPLSCACLR